MPQLRRLPLLVEVGDGVRLPARRGSGRAWCRTRRSSPRPRAGWPGRRRFPAAARQAGGSWPDVVWGRTVWPASCPTPAARRLPADTPTAGGPRGWPWRTRWGRCSGSRGAGCSNFPASGGCTGRSAADCAAGRRVRCCVGGAPLSAGSSLSRCDEARPAVPMVKVVRPSLRSGRSTLTTGAAGRGEHLSGKPLEGPSTYPTKDSTSFRWSMPLS